jgi:hypothetical protein
MDEQNLEMPKSWTEMLDNLGIDDPRMRLFAEMMEKQKAATSSESSLEEKLAKKKRALARIEKLGRENKELQQENQLLRERLDLLAAALGACPDCWGELPDCTICRGRGVPGCFIPDRDNFVAYILPAVKTIQHSRQSKKITKATERSQDSLE